MSSTLDRDGSVDLSTRSSLDRRPGAGQDRDETGGCAPVVIIGAGPAGLTAALELVRRDRPVIVFEASDQIGGISRTEQRNGWRFDIGGHRFFTKVPEVEKFWHEVLDDDEFMLRPRMSRILYGGKLYDYPLRAMNALRNLGPVEAVRCVASYAYARVRPPKDQSHFEGWVAARFGYRLYRIFFKTYTEKLWGIKATEIQADWAAQRIKNLSLMNAITNALRPKKGQTAITTLIDRFQYPKYGPGMMWERARELVEKDGGQVVMNAPVVSISREDGESGGGHASAVTALVDGQPQRVPATAVISSMPLSELVLAFDPPAPEEVQQAARSLRYRDYLTVALVVPVEAGFPDNWIYVHTPGVKVGRVQNYGSWSPYMVKEGFTCLGLEYFVNEGDETWSASDEDLIRLATAELEQLKLVQPGSVSEGYVVRVAKAYPVYDEGYQERVETIRRWLDAAAPNVAPVGRNGMHKYNNQDHSMLTAMYAVENILGGSRDLWSVNVEEEYHEEKSGDAAAAAEKSAGSTGYGTNSGSGGTGRAAPILPAPTSGERAGAV